MYFVVAVTNPLLSDLILIWCVYPRLDAFTHKGHFVGKVQLVQFRLLDFYNEMKDVREATRTQAWKEQEDLSRPDLVCTAGICIPCCMHHVPGTKNSLYCCMEAKILQ